MSNSPRLEIKNVIVCDDVRREDNGKELLIGVYSGGILVQQFPAPLPLAFWIQFFSAEVGQVWMEIRLISGPDVQFFRLRSKMGLDKPGYGSIGIGPLPLTFQVPSKLSLQMRFDGDGDWTTISEVMVEKRMDEPASSAPAKVPA